MTRYHNIDDAEFISALHDLIRHADNSTRDHEVLEAVQLAKAYGREQFGMTFDDDDALGSVEPGPGDRIIFLPLAETPPPNRPKLAAPTSGWIEGVQADIEATHTGFPYLVVLDDARDEARRTRLFASRDEIQIVERAERVAGS